MPNGHWVLTFSASMTRQVLLVTKQGVGSFDPSNSDIDFGALKNHATQTRQKIFI